MSAPIEIIARAAVIRDGRLLAAQERGKRWYFLPGGHVERGETVEAALIRELREELGAPATITGFMGVVEHGYTPDGGTGRQELNLVFAVELPDAPPISREPHLQFSWLPLAALPGTDLRPAPLRTALPHWMRDRLPFWHPWSVPA